MNYLLLYSMKKHQLKNEEISILLLISCFNLIKQEKKILIYLFIYMYCDIDIIKNNKMRSSRDPSAFLLNGSV